MLHPKPASVPAAAATGVLAKRPLAHLMVYAVEHAMSGTFAFASETGERAHIVVEAGMISRVATTEPVVHLGQVLYENGFIDGSALSSSLAEVASTKRLHGQVLLARRMITRAQLAAGLRQQRARKLARLFALPQATSFAFYPGVDLVGARPDDAEPMDPLPAVWRGLHKHPSWEHVRSTIATVGGRPLRIRGSLDRLGLTGKDLLAAMRIEESSATVADLVAHAGLEPYAADLLAYFLVITKTAEIAPAPSSAPPPSAEERVRAPGGLGQALPSGEYVRRVSFSMRAVTADAAPLRIPSPIGGMTPSPVSRLPGSLRLRIETPFVSPPPTSSRPSPASRPDVRPPASRRPQSGSMDASPVAREADQALSEAEMQLLSGDRAKAIDRARRALTLAPGMPAATAFLAYLEALGAGAGQEAYLRDLLRVVDAAIVEEETCRRARYYRAEIKKRLRDHEGAIRDLRAAIRNDPDDVDAHRELNAYERRVHQGTIILRSISPAAGTPRPAELGDRRKPRG
jgi:hypothetical protein